MPSTPLLGSYGDNSSSAIGFRNRIINGDCRIAQRSSAAVANNTIQYAGCDRIFAVPLSFTTVTAGTQQRSALADVSSGFGQWITGLSTTGTGSVLFGQRIEDVFVSDFNGKNVVFSGVAYQNSGSTLTCTIDIRKANALNNFSTSTSLASTTISVPSGVTTPFQFSIGLGSSDATNGISCQFSFAVTSSLTTRNFAVSNLQFEAGTIASPFETRYYWDEFKLCQRYYQATRGGLITPKPGTTNELIIANTNTSNLFTRSGTWTLTLPDAQYTVGSPTGNQWNVYTPGLGFGAKTGTVSFIGDGGPLFTSSGATFTFGAQWVSSGTSGLFFNGELT